jgi:hypothetical protein
MNNDPRTKNLHRDTHGYPVTQIAPLHADIKLYVPTEFPTVWRLIEFILDGQFQEVENYYGLDSIRISVAKKIAAEHFPHFFEQYADCDDLPDEDPDIVRLRQMRYTTS